MSDSFTETTSTSWFNRIGNSFKGMVVGFILFIVAFPVLFWNEGRTIKQTKSLNQTEADLVLAKCDEVNQENDGKPVYMTGDAKTEDVLKDDIFPVSVNGFQLKRKVEVYQWVEHEKSETKKKLGGGEETVTTYTYTKEWGDKPIDSTKFKKPEEHENYPWDCEGTEYVATSGTFGAFTLSESIIHRLNWFESYKIEPPAQEESAPATPAPTVETPAVPVAPAVPSATTADDVPATPVVETPATLAPATQPVATATTVPAVQTDVRVMATPPAAQSIPVTQTAPATPTTQTTQVVQVVQVVPAKPTPQQIAEAAGVPEGYIFYNGGFYKGDPKKLSVGDTRVTFEYVPATATISLISQQAGDTFTPYQTKYNQIELVEKGVVSAEAMFENAHAANSFMCWILRLVGFLMMFFGLRKIFEPLETIADVVPFIGGIVGMGLGLACFLLAAGLSLMTIAIGWIFYRPLIGIPLAVVAAFFLIWPLIKGFTGKAKPATEA